jgi:hypothetical protein
MLLCEKSEFLQWLISYPNTLYSSGQTYVNMAPMEVRWLSNAAPTFKPIVRRIRTDGTSLQDTPYYELQGLIGLAWLWRL